MYDQATAAGLELFRIVPFHSDNWPGYKHVITRKGIIQKVMLVRASTFCFAEPGTRIPDAAAKIYPTLVEHSWEQNVFADVAAQLRNLDPDTVDNILQSWKAALPPKPAEPEYWNPVNCLKKTVEEGLIPPAVAEDLDVRRMLAKYPAWVSNQAIERLPSVMKGNPSMTREDMYNLVHSVLRRTDSELRGNPSAHAAAALKRKIPQGMGGKGIGTGAKAGKGGRPQFPQRASNGTSSGHLLPTQAASNGHATARTFLPPSTGAEDSSPPLRPWAPVGSLPQDDDGWEPTTPPPRYEDPAGGAALSPFKSPPPAYDDALGYPDEPPPPYGP